MRFVIISNCLFLSSPDLQSGLKKDMVAPEQKRFIYINQELSEKFCAIEGL